MKKRTLFGLQGRGFLDMNAHCNMYLRLIQAPQRVWPHYGVVTVIEQHPV